MPSSPESLRIKLINLHRPHPESRTISAVRLAHPDTGGYWWHLQNFEDFNHFRGLYEWRVWFTQGDRRRLRAIYVGKATKYSGRIPLYWRDMSPQLVEHFHRTKCLLRRPVKVRWERKPLRWIHLWLAWAFINRAEVVLRLLPLNGEALDDAEMARIKKQRARKLPIVNDSANVDVMRRRIWSDEGESRRCDEPTPPDWRLGQDDKTTDAWRDAIDRWSRAWRAGP